MTTIRVIGGVGDLARDMQTIAVEAQPRLARVVRSSAEEGNRIARAFASEQHTMHTAIDVPYQESFSAEARGPLEWEYGPEADNVPHGGSQAVGYEHGSRNQPPHLDLARSVDIVHVRYGDAVLDEVDRWFW